MSTGLLLKSPSIVMRELDNGQGFWVTSPLDHACLDRVWGLVLESFGSCFGVARPGRSDVVNIHLDDLRQDRFKTLSVFDRTLSRSSADSLLKEDWLAQLCSDLGYYPIDAHSDGYPTFTWRLMRPGQHQDLRGLHRDGWFRTANQGAEIIDADVSRNLQTIKVWMALNVVCGKSGLLVSPGSQLNERPGYDVVSRDNLIKPAVRESELKVSEFQHADTVNGSMVLFGERLMHGGAPTLSESSRLSLEFCLARPTQDFYPTFKG